MKTLPTVHELRKQGFKVKVSHYRLFYRYCSWTGRRLENIAYGTTLEDAGMHYLLDQYGGRTVVELSSPDGKSYFGQSDCSKNDRYIKSFGLKKALLRAYGQYFSKTLTPDE